jgi:hypothetical protein
MPMQKGIGKQAGFDNRENAVGNGILKLGNPARGISEQIFS